MGRLETADILPLVKEAAILNLLNSQPDDLLFLLGVLISVFVAFVVINTVLLRNSLTLTQLTLPSFFVGAYVFLMSVPSILWFYASTTASIRYTYFLAVQSVLVCLPLGVVLANAVCAVPLASLKAVMSFSEWRLLQTDADRYFIRFWLLMFLLAVAVATVYILTSNYVPLIGAVTVYGDVPGAEVRRSVFWDGAPIHYSHALTARFFLPVCLVYSYFMAGVYKGSWRYLFWITLLVAIFISTLTFDRTYPFSVVVFLGLGIYFKHKIPTVPVRGSRRKPSASTASRIRLGLSIGAMIAVSMVVGGIISTTQYNFPLTIDAIREASAGFLVNRVFLDASYMAYIYFDEFDHPSTFLYGTSVHPLISTLFGVDFHPTISPSFIAELWINFGWLGVLVGTITIGFVLQLIQLKMFNHKSIPVLTFYVIMLLNGAWIIYGHVLATMVVSVYLPSVMLLVLLKRRNRRQSRGGMLPAVRRSGLASCEQIAGRM